MNPILQHLGKVRQTNASQTNLASQANEIMEAVKRGEINPRSKVLELINGMSASQKETIKNALPKIIGYAKFMGIDTQNALSELQSRM